MEGGQDSSEDGSAFGCAGKRSIMRGGFLLPLAATHGTL